MPCPWMRMKRCDATLVRSDPSLRGITRRSIATEEGEVMWEYIAPDGEPVEEEEVIASLERAMGLPPAWKTCDLSQPTGPYSGYGTRRERPVAISLPSRLDGDHDGNEVRRCGLFCLQLPRLRRQVARTSTLAI